MKLVNRDALGFLGGEDTCEEILARSVVVHTLNDLVSTVLEMGLPCLGGTWRGDVLLDVFGDWDPLEYRYPWKKFDTFENGFNPEMRFSCRVC